MLRIRHKEEEEVTDGPSKKKQKHYDTNSIHLRLPCLEKSFSREDSTLQKEYALHNPIEWACCIRLPHRDYKTSPHTTAA